MMRTGSPKTSWWARRMLVAVLLVTPLFVYSETRPGGLAEYAVKRPSGARGTVVVPETFLRRWDAITVFFEQPLGPGQNRPEDHPGTFVTVTPPQPGAWTWLDERTLQFRPAVPWPPLGRYTVTAGAETVVLDTLMEAPIETIPANNARELLDVDTITLTFADPIDPGALARMIDIELRPLPGVDARGASHLAGDDFVVKALERAGPAAPARYVLILDEPVPPATRAIVSFHLALEDATEAFARFTFATAEPFHVTAVACGASQLPLGVGGARYAPSQALLCSSRDSSIRISFSAPLGAVDPVTARRFVRIDPPTADRTHQVYGATLDIRGDFAPERLYRVRIEPVPLFDESGRALEMEGESEVYVSFPGSEPFLRWGAAQGVVERYGPGMVPLEGQGFDRADLRIYPVPPLERALWPFPDEPVVVDESRRPPGPGEEPPPVAPRDRVSADTLAAYIATLGSPPVSTIVALHPMGGRESHRFGLDLAPHLAAIDGKNAPGTYLVGLRPLDGRTTRAWMRIQVTDLSLTAVEGAAEVEFFVTSLSTGAPVSSAEVTLEGSRLDAERKPEWTILGRVVTDRRGRGAFPTPGPGRKTRIGRIVVRKGDDILVLDPLRAPDGYRDNHWSKTEEPWLQWTFMEVGGRGPAPRTLCHVFSERPVYRPEEPVHIKGYVREWAAGKLSIIRPEAELHLEGPGGATWDFGLYITEAGSFYFLFDEEDMPAGIYTGSLRVHDDFGAATTCARMSFRKEAYRLPRFEVRLHGPDQVPLDRPFEVSLSSGYYAGGPVAARPVRWRVTQYPYTFDPPRLEGFLYSSDGRFSRTATFESTAQLTREDVTDAQGACTLALDPTIEPTAQPRTYVIEATVTGDDDQTVTTTRQIKAVPPFVLGVRTPRFLPRADHVTPEIIMVGYDGKRIPDRQVVVRLIGRQWHSRLQAGDFSDGVARYLTDIVDTPVAETLAVTGREPVQVSLPVPRAGVYIVEVEARDALGRAQVVAVDLYAGGDEPVTWQKPQQRVFTVSPDQEAYDPGDTAELVIQSPFQDARALVVIEAPDGNTYGWTRVRGGSATVTVPIRGEYAPRLPVHVVVMRGRIEAPPPSASNPVDLGKPATVAATTWLEVRPRDNLVNVSLEYPKKAQPGETIPVTIRLTDPDGGPLPGEVTLWLVDQAVLALGKEQRIDPLPDFIRPRPSYLVIRDTRELPFGFLPVAQVPGGGEGPTEEPAPLDKVTVRRNFCPIPYYQPEIAIPSSGVATVQVPLTDDLTNFKIRAKAASGAERFGFATGMVSVRLPVLVQPALPRFVRPGDAFVAEATARVIEGPEGEARARLHVEGATVRDQDSLSFALAGEQPARIGFPVEVPMPALTPEGTLSRTDVLVRLRVQRTADGVGDGFEVRLPLIDAGRRVTRRRLVTMAPGKPLEFPAIPKDARPGSVKRAFFVTNQPVLVDLADGLDFLLEYPYGCTEQKLSRARAILSTRAFRELLHLEERASELDAAVKETLEALPRAVDGRGLVAYWPGARGYVSLTAWTLEFLQAASDRGYTIDSDLRHTLKRALRRALRSDAAGLIDGERDGERTMALLALAQAGDFDPGYAAELARRAAYLDQEGKARVALAFSLGGRGEEIVAQALADDLWHGVVIEQREGKPVYGGLQDSIEKRSALVLPSEARTLALTIRAIERYQPDEPRLPPLIDALVTLGKDGGWGTTNANAAAMAALAQRLQPPLPPGPEARIDIRAGDDNRVLEVSGEQPAATMVTTARGPGRVRLAAGPDQGEIVLRLAESWLPGEDVGLAEPFSRGFVVTRELLVVQPGDAPPVKHAISEPGITLELATGDVIEDHLQVVNPADRHQVAITVPLAAGLDPLNPALATAPPEATPSRPPTLAPTHVAMLDDRVAYYYDTLPKGTYDFRFRARAIVPGRFNQPPAMAEMMYDSAVAGGSPGARVQVVRAGE